MTLDDREKVVLETLEKLSKQSVVLIGGYAVNAYVPPRFSIDCDLVVLGSPRTIEDRLKKEGFVKAKSGDVSYGSYIRYEKEPSKVSFDLIFNSVVDRDTQISFESELFKKYSAERTTVGRIAPIRIRMAIADPELLFAMKFVAVRRQDVRDIFMLAGEKLEWELVNKLISEKCDTELIKMRVDFIRKSVISKSYRDSLQGPYGKLPDKRFETCKKVLTNFLKEITRQRN